MESLAKSLYAATSSAVEEFIDRLVAELGVDKDAALAIWAATGEDLKIVDAPKKAVPKKTVSSSAGKKPSKSDDSKKTCTYVYVKGDKEGDFCGAKVSDESETGTYCKKHVSHDKKGDEKKVSTVTKKSTTVTAKKPGKKAEAKEAEAEVIASLKEKAPVFSVKMNGFKNYEHEGTGLLFDRKTEDVYGRQKKDGSITPLTSDDIETCKKLGFKFRLPERMTSKEDKVEEEDDEEEEVAEDEDEEDEEDED